MITSRFQIGLQQMFSPSSTRLSVTTALYTNNKYYSETQNSQCYVQYMADTLEWLKMCVFLDVCVLWKLMSSATVCQSSIEKGSFCCRSSNCLWIHFIYGRNRLLAWLPKKGLSPKCFHWKLLTISEHTEVWMRYESSVNSYELYDSHVLLCQTLARVVLRYSPLTCSEF